LRGAAIDRFRNKTVEFEPGTVIYRPPGERHAHQFGAAGVAAIVIEVPPFRLGSHSSLCFLSELRATSNILALADSARLIRCMTHPETFEDEAEEHCFLLLTAFNRDGEKASSSDGVGRVRMFLDQCIPERHSLAELGLIAGLHPAYLVNAFRKRFGCTIGRYRKDRCAALAIKKIWNTRLPLSEIALESGFYDQSHCTNELRKHLRLTPGQIREMMTFNSSKTQQDLRARITRVLQPAAFARLGNGSVGSSSKPDRSTGPMES